MANCPECEALLEVDEDEVEEGDVISCSECGLEMEVVHQSPLEVERLEDEEDEEEEGESDYEEDDYSDDDYDDDEDDDEDDGDDKE